jgi:alginate O-acetyltransferase complex protein AlgI
MSFTSAAFWVFFATFFALYLLSRGLARRVLLLLASYAFYASWDARFLALLIGTTLLDYNVALRVDATQEPLQRKRLLLVSVIGNLAVLSYFKYSNFFLDSALALARELGVAVQPHHLSIALPVGISFYTFQSLSYTIDVYRRKVPATRSLLDYATYVGFFTHITAGPIERAAHFLPQLQSQVRANPFSRLAIGLIALGCFKKVLADHFAGSVDPIYSDLERAQPLAVWLATYWYAAQIYLDFSGYSDIAVGLGALMGFKVVQNFCAPYAATSPSDFWRRWHISLSTWLRDYLYISLGGNRGGELRTARNLFITMLLGGLWHGAAWNYVLWGAYHGVVLAIARLPVIQRIPLGDTGLGLFVKRWCCFHLICVGWALFRARSLADCGIVLGKLLDPTEFNVFGFLASLGASGDGKRVACLLVLAALVGVCHYVAPGTPSEWVKKAENWPSPVRYGLVAALLYGALVLSPQAAPTFIYFKF